MLLIKCSEYIELQMQSLYPGMQHLSLYISLAFYLLKVIFCYCTSKRKKLHWALPWVAMTVVLQKSWRRHWSSSQDFSVMWKTFIQKALTGERNYSGVTHLTFDQRNILENIDVLREWSFCVLQFTNDLAIKILRGVWKQRWGYSLLPCMRNHFSTEHKVSPWGMPPGRNFHNRVGLLDLHISSLWQNNLVPDL